MSSCSWIDDRSRRQPSWRLQACFAGPARKLDFSVMSCGAARRQSQHQSSIDLMLDAAKLRRHARLLGGVDTRAPLPRVRWPVPEPVPSRGAAIAAVHSSASQVRAGSVRRCRSIIRCASPKNGRSIDNHHQRPRRHLVRSRAGSRDDFLLAPRELQRSARRLMTESIEHRAAPVARREAQVPWSVRQGRRDHDAAASRSKRSCRTG